MLACMAASNLARWSGVSFASMSSESGGGPLISAWLAISHKPGLTLSLTDSAAVASRAAARPATSVPAILQSVGCMAKSRWLGGSCPDLKAGLPAQQLPGPEGRPWRQCAVHIKQRFRASHGIISSTVSTTALCLALFAVTLGLLAVAALVLARKLRRLRSMLRRQERHVWETHNVFQVLRGGVPLPVPGGWAASTDLLGELLRAVAHRRPQRVVELGSGLSTLIIAAALRSNGAGRLISIDADRNYAAITRSELERQGLADWAEVRIAPLTESLFEGEARQWYDTTVLAD